jgi:rhomboid protease GluP
MLLCLRLRTILVTGSLLLLGHEHINPTIDVRKSSKKDPFSNHVNLAINIITLGLGLVSGTQLQVIRDYGFVPYALFHINNNMPDIITRLFSSIFIHSGIVHLAFNILVLAYIGAYSERSVGVTRYVLIYILSGIAGVLFHSVIASYILGTGHVILI